MTALTQQTSTGSRISGSGFKDPRPITAQWRHIYDNAVRRYDVPIPPGQEFPGSDVIQKIRTGYSIHEYQVNEAYSHMEPIEKWLMAGDWSPYGGSVRGNSVSVYVD